MTMNAKRRNTIKHIIDKIDDIVMELEMVLDEEQEAYDNMPENIQESDRGSEMCDGIDAMTDVRDMIEEAGVTLSELV